MYDNIVIAVRLADVNETHQPDPLCVQVSDLSTWRHFETLLKSMFTDAPDCIRVKYLDDEGDWVELGSDGELAEAIRIVQESGEILQLQVKSDRVVHYESTLQTRTTDPDQTPLTKLVYPHQTNKKTPQNPTRQTPDAPLEYPHPHYNNVMILKANGQALYVESDSAVPLSKKINMLRENDKVLDEQRKKSLADEFQIKEELGQAEKVKALRKMLADNSKQLNAGNNGWEEARKLDRDAKLKFLKDMFVNKTENKTEAPAKEKVKNIVDDDVFVSMGSENDQELPPPLCPGQGSLGQNGLANQDPFELVSNKNTEELEKIFTSEVLKPKLLTPQRNSDMKKDTDSKTDGSRTASPPVAMPRKLTMMEGAQSGANAVTVDMPEPEIYINSTPGQQEIEASGGASAETGEVTNREGYSGAAVCREVKPQSSGSSAGSVASPEIPARKSVACKKPTKTLSSKKSPPTLKELSECLGVGAKPKTPKREEKKRSCKKLEKDDKYILKKKERKLVSCCKEQTPEKAAVLETVAKSDVTKDVESGEKTIVEDTSGNKSLKYEEFTRYMKKLERDMRSGIVKDVTKQTGKLLRDTYTRSMSVGSSTTTIAYPRVDTSTVEHSGILCDNCNTTIFGFRYKCGNCKNFDLCQTCEGIEDIHDSTHVFLKLKTPLLRAGRVNGKYVPLLRENIYLMEQLRRERKELKMHEKRTQKQQRSELKKRPKIETVVDLIPETPESVEIHNLDMAQGVELKPLIQEIKIEEKEEVPLIPITTLASPIPTTNEIFPERSEQKDQEQEKSGEDLNPLPVVEKKITVSITNTQDEEFSLFGKDEETEIEEQTVSEQKEANDENDENQEEEVGEDSKLLEESGSQCLSWDDYERLETASYSSEDFCVIDPPSDCEYFSGQSDIEQIEAQKQVPENIQENKNMDEETVVEASAVDNGESSRAVETDYSVSSIEEIEPSEIENMTDGQRASLVEEGLVHEMTEEEKTHYRQLLKASIDPLYVESLKKRAEELETIVRQQQETELRVILESKQEEARRANERLEEAEKRKAEEERREREEEERKKEERLRSEKEREMREEAEHIQKELEEEREMKRKSLDNDVEVQVMKMVEEYKKEETNRSRQSSVSSDFCEKRDADSQTYSDPQGQTVHLLQNVATNVTKAASSAFSTARDVFYSLQAKQSQKEWSMPSSDYTPPKSSWTPPGNKWTPPTSTWEPPSDTYVPPTSKWVPPPGMYFTPPPGEQEEITESEETVKELSEEEKKKETELAALGEMGFTNETRNRTLYLQYSGDIDKILHDLLEDGDDHWAQHRH